MWTDRSFPPLNIDLLFATMQAVLVKQRLSFSGADDYDDSYSYDDYEDDEYSYEDNCEDKDEDGYCDYDDCFDADEAGWNILY